LTHGMSVVQRRRWSASGTAVMDHRYKLSIVLAMLCCLGLSACATAPKASPPAPSYADFMSAGEILARDGQIDDAIMRFSDAAAAEPTNAAPWERTAQLRFDAGDYGRAIVAAQEALDRDPHSWLADSVLTVSGLRVAVGSLERLRDAAATSTSARSEAETLVASLRTTLGESNLIAPETAQAPSKPILHARLPDGTLLFGLPGNPMATAVGMRFFVIPALRALQGMAQERQYPAVTTTAIRGRDQLCFFAKGYAETDTTGRRSVRILPGQESFRIAPLLQANCWAIVPAGAGEIPAGTTLATVPLYPDDCFGAPSPQ